MTEVALETRPQKFSDPDWTAGGEPRAYVALQALRTLWINTGSLCNITCRNCYINSSPENDRLAYITRAEVLAFLDEIAETGLPTQEIGFTGGEPFMNPDILAMLEDALARGLPGAGADQCDAADAASRHPIRAPRLARRPWLPARDARQPRSLRQGAA